MLESVGPRSGVNPITGDEMHLASETGKRNEIKGNEWTIADQDDLQYACVFPLLSPRVCASDIACDCQDPTDDNPLCAPTAPTVQIKAKAYPGIRHLQLLKSMGDQGVVASVCPAQIEDPSQSDFGSPSLGSSHLARPTLAYPGSPEAPP